MPLIILVSNIMGDWDKIEQHHIYNLDAASTFSLQMLLTVTTIQRLL